MACTDLFLGGYKDGEIPYDSASDAYVAGQPAKIGPDGASLLKNTIPGTSEDAFIGLFKNDSTIDAAVGVVTVYGLGNKVKIWNDGSGLPFDSTQVYVNGGAWGINAAGLITSLIPVGGKKMGNTIKGPMSVTDTYELVIKA